MQYKKKNRDDRGNYRALGLLNHAFKVFGMILLIRIFPFIMPKLSDMQAGFRKERGCRDNILILVMVIQHLLKNSDDGEYILLICPCGKRGATSRLASTAGVMIYIL